MTIKEVSAWVTSVGGAVAMLAAGLAWAWSVHNAFLMEMISPLLRSSYSARINNYRRMECMGALNATTREALEEALLSYEELVGRPISDRSCDSL